MFLTNLLYGMVAVATIVAIILLLTFIYGSEREKLIRALKKSGLCEPIILVHVDETDWRIVHLGEARSPDGLRVKFRTCERFDGDIRILMEDSTSGEHYPERSLAV